ncbi:glycine--tRNA ligase subunit beta [Hyphomonas sp.]|uniref:glycine--tRNA ligase subunit beta n=1 Tax=Hyphomonas sp. TaxID=87 RepID=UPI00391DCC57
MAELLIELFSEEIPARMQAKAEADLLAALTQRLKEAGLGWTQAFAVSGPRRLTAVVEGLDARSADVREEKKGPKVGAPEQAVAGFLRGAGLKDISEAEIVSDPKKGDFYVAYISTPGRDAKDIIAEAVPEIVRNFHWPKSMRTADGDLRWVRPLQGIVCVLDGAVVPFDVGGVASGNVTEGHRVHGRGPYTVNAWKDYKAQLEGKGHVILSRDDRRNMILEGINKVCAGAGLDWIEDKGLLEEVVGLAEWPVVVLGQMDPGFLDLPPEVITLSMRTHQKYFAANDAKSGKLAPVFIVVANISASDGGVKIAEGNARVLSARLSDARFFWEKDKATPLEEMAAKLKTIAFKEELGSLGDKVERVAALARELAPKVGADPDLAERAARLAKADLVSEMVGEFPELQGVMGRYYALAAGEDARIADAIRDHYKPQGPNDSVPTDPVSIAVALADKLDTLTGFWAIDEKPTGSKDPFALRRAALGVVRLILENKIRFSLDRFNDAQVLKHQIGPQAVDWSAPSLSALSRAIMNEGVFSDAAQGALAAIEGGLPDWAHRVSAHDPSVSDDLLDFLHERLKVYLRDRGARHDWIDACLGMPDRCDLVLIVKRVEALAAFLATEDGATLLAGYRRAANILKAEEKKGALPEGLAVDAKLISKGPAEEQALFAALSRAEAALEAPLRAEDFAGAMRVLAGLRAPVDAFFEAVMVNDADPAVRANRLALLVAVRGALHKVADFSKIEG